MDTTARVRPSRAQIEPAALDLIERHGAQIMSTARRYSVTAEDAEDAYQRGLEILLTKAPSTSEDDLVPWLKTVVKHEAFAVRKQRWRTPPVSAVIDGDEDSLQGEQAAPETIDDEAERHERLRLGAEAMGRLKPQEVRALLLKADGLTYKEIQDETGWTYTKVNRCITEGRRAFVERVHGIESGAECERLAPLLSALADGEASADDVAVLRPHVRSCLACRARLREYRAAPVRVAALAPVVGVGAATGGAGSGGGSFLDWLHAHAMHTAMRVHTLFEAASTSKAAAVVGATAAIAGGGVAAVHELEPAHHHRPAHRRHAHVQRHPAATVRVTTPERAALHVKAHRTRPAQPQPTHVAAPAPTAAPPRPVTKQQAPAEPQPKSAAGAPGEFGP
ncbi:MAG: sigma-70 family RNA polymerase sigma factor [Thermoleophilaceae bacterium]